MQQFDFFMSAIRKAWDNRLHRVFAAAKAVDSTQPGAKQFYTEGYRTGYWDGIEDALMILQRKEDTSHEGALLR